MGMLVNPYRHATTGADPHFANTIVLLSMDGANGSSTYTDESAAARGTATASSGGFPLINTTTKLYGTASARFSIGADDDIQFPDHDDFTLGTSDFTCEGFIQYDGNTATQCFCSKYVDTGNQRAFSFEYRGGDATDNLAILAASDGTSAVIVCQGNWTPTVATWYWICFERSGTTFRIYAGEPGGTASVIGSSTSSVDIFGGTSPLRIGRLGTALSFKGFVGYIDEFRFTKGVARYNTGSSFAVPTGPWPRS